MTACAAGAREIADAVQGLDGAHPREAVAWALSAFPRGRVAVVTGLQSDGIAVLDMAMEVDREVRVITIDTGRLPAETYEYLDSLRRFYDRDIEVIFPERRPLERFTGQHGVNSFYASHELRLECCRLRKVEPLREALSTLDCWLTGLRRDQAESRESIPVVERDQSHGGIVKVNPLASWTADDTLAHLRDRGVPLHPLYARGYRSIGCAPCTRAVAEGEDERAGRWWWENGINKECGIHTAARNHDTGENP